MTYAYYMIYNHEIDRGICIVCVPSSEFGKHVTIFTVYIYIYREREMLYMYICIYIYIYIYIYIEDPTAPVLLGTQVVYVGILNNLEMLVFKINQHVDIYVFLILIKLYI